MNSASDRDTREVQLIVHELRYLAQISGARNHAGRVIRLKNPTVIV